MSEERIRKLRDNSPIRIEHYINTMRAKREARFASAYSEISKVLKKFSKREIIIAGFFLYWAEGNKTRNASFGLTNTDPNMLKFYIRWMELLGVKKSQMKVHLHLYSDMNIEKQKKFWSDTLSIPLSQFRKPYIKNTCSSSITYKNGFGQGTCSVLVEGARLSEKILMGVKYVQENSLI